jgi:hypothetical protein
MTDGHVFPRLGHVGQVAADAIVDRQLAICASNTTALALIDFDIEAMANSVASVAGALSSTFASPRVPDVTTTPFRTTA